MKSAREFLEPKTLKMPPNVHESQKRPRLMFPKNAAKIYNTYLVFRKNSKTAANTENFFGKGSL